MSGELLLDRLEFSTVNIRCNIKAEAQRDPNFPQLQVQFDKYKPSRRSSLHYDPASAEDPRVFALTYGVKFESDKELMPYDIEVEAIAFFHYEGDGHVGVDRFRAVRMSGYQILYGAIREMVANISARSRHGCIQLPARNFNARAKEDAESDESARQQHLNAISDIEIKPLPKPPRRRKQVK